MAGIIDKTMFFSGLRKREPTPEPTPWQKAGGYEQKAPGFEKKAPGFGQKAAGFWKKAPGFGRTQTCQTHTLCHRLNGVAALLHQPLGGGGGATDADGLDALEP